MAGKRQHYVPRFLQRGFLDDHLEEAERTWLHRRGAEARLVGIRDVGVRENFYSKLRADGVATLDDLITAIEGNLDRELAAIRMAPVGELIDSTIAARLTAHLLMRTAHVRSVVEQAATHVFDGAIELFTSADNVRDYLGVDEFGGATGFDKILADVLQAVPLEELSFPRPLAQRMLTFMARERFDAFYEENGPALFGAITESIKSISSLVRDAHNKALETGDLTRWEQRLAELSWRTQSVVGAVLPDCVVLAREVNQDFTPFLLSASERVELVVLPLAHDRLLLGSRIPNVEIAVDSFNAASAACSDSFFISRRAYDGLGLSELIGQRCTQAITASVRDALSDFRRPRDARASRRPAEPRITETESLPSYSFSLTCLNFADSDMAERLGEILKVIVRETGRCMPLSSLDGITFARDYSSALEGLDRGDPAIGAIQSQPRDYGRPVAKCVQVVRGGESKTHIVIDCVVAEQLFSDDENSRALAIHMIVTMLAGVAHTALYEAQLKGSFAVPLDEVIRLFYEGASAAPGSYFGARESAFCDPTAGERYADLVRDSLAAAREAVRVARLAYRLSNDLDALLGVALRQISFVLTHTAEWLGHRDGLPAQEGFPGSLLPDDLKALGLDLWLELFGRDLCSLYDAEGQFTSTNIFALGRHVERLLWTVQICPWPMEDGSVYVSVPIGDDAGLIEARPTGGK